MELTPYEIIVKLNEILDRLRNTNLDGTEAMQALKAIIFSQYSPEIVSKVLGHPAAAVLSQQFSASWTNYLGKLEVEFSKNLLEGSANDSSLLALENYNSNFLEVDSLPPNCLIGQFIMAGCGAYPETLINLQKTKHLFSRIIALDSSTQALELASGVIHKFSATNEKIDFIHEDASTYNYESANMLLIANGLKNKQSTIRQAIDTMPPSSILLVRVPILLAKLIYEDVSVYLEHSGLTIVDCLQPSSHSKTYIIRL